MLAVHIYEDGVKGFEMDKKMELTKIIIKMSDKKELSLTPDEARELRDILDNLLGEKETVYIPQPYPLLPYAPPYIPPCVPYRPYPGYWWTDGTGTITVCSDANTASNT